ncbi:MAG: ABC transporter permease, partial [Gemmatimonadaceae bacterium]
GRAALAAYTGPDSAFVDVDNAPHNVRVVYATSSYFPVLGAGLSLGRSFTEQENRLDAGVPVAVISYGMWQREFGGDSTVLGKHLEVALARYTIIGVAARDFNGPDLDATDLWLPIAMRPARPIGDIPWFQEWRSGSYVRIIARPHSGVTPAAIGVLATTVYRRGEREHVANGPDTTATVLPGPLLEALGPSITPPVEQAITSRLLAVTIIVLLVACANVANLLLLRGLRRRRETAIRLSLGISRGRLLRQLLMESTLLALVASVVAIGVAWWGGALLRVMILPSVHWAGSPVTWRVVIACVGVAIVTGVVAGVAPAMHAGRTDLAAALKAGAREGGRHRSRLRAGLVAAQVALSVVLLAGAGLFVHSLAAVQGVNVGYDLNRITYGTVHFRNTQGRYVEFGAGDHAAEMATGLAAVAARMRADPDVESTALATAPPMGGYAGTALKLQDGSIPPRLDNRDPALIAANASYFAVTGVKLLQGRFYTAEDERDGAAVVVVNETAAHTYWPGRTALGQCVVLDRRGHACHTVIGVARDSHLEHIVETPTIELFIPIPHTAGFLSHPTDIVVRGTAAGSGRVAAALRTALAREFPTAEPPDVTSAATAREPELRPWRLGATLFSLFGALALIVAALGVYSTLAYAVNQRLHEVGIRMALGARHGQVVRLVLAQGMRALLVGVVAGLVLTVLLGRFVSAMLYDTRTTNSLVLGGAAAVLLVTGIVGSLVPA